MKKKITLTILIGIPTLAFSIISIIYWILVGSLPVENGTLVSSELTSPIEIEWDHLAIPTITASSREEISYALGFLHAQNRFFQMDLMRRAAGGELSELFGKAALQFDKERRRHRLRSVAQRTMDLLTAEERRNLIQYSQGVSLGLKKMKRKPFEYYLLGLEPRPWDPIDSILVGMGMFFELQDSAGSYDITQDIMRKHLPEELLRFFLDNGSAWDTPIDGNRIDMIEIPNVEKFEFLHPSTKEVPSNSIRMKGSNQWAVNGKYTSDGMPILACDMHLNLSLPSLWYRASWKYIGKEHQPVEMHGATLPGTPVMVLGTNRLLVWG